MSTSSFEQDEQLARHFQRTPGTPIKVVNQTPRRSSRKRCLFEPSPRSTPEKSDDLGPMSPLSASSDDSYVSGGSPCFSPNGKFSTPPKTPVRSTGRPIERVCTRKIEITSSLFPNLKLNSTKSHRRPCTPRRSERLTPKKSYETVSSEDVLRDLTPPKSFKKVDKLVNDKVESDSSQNVYGSTPRRSRKSVNETPVSKFGIKPISSDSFYGPEPPSHPKVRTQLFIDSLGPKIDPRKRSRSLSMDSLSSNKSFVSGHQKKRKLFDTFSKPKSSRRNRHKGPLAGVWHGVKKPKKMKPAKSTNKHVLSTKSRVTKMFGENKAKSVQVKPNRSVEEKQSRKTAKKKKSMDGGNESDIIDPFPHHLVKRKKLPTSAHPSTMVNINDEAESPDPNKKFMKYGMKRKMTFTLNENLKLQFSDGVMRLQSPKKRRKLYSGKNDLFFDPYDEEEKDAAVKENIENILSKLHNEKNEENAQKGEMTTPDKVKKMTRDLLLKMLDSPRSKMSHANVTPSKVLIQRQNDAGNKLLANLSSLAINGLPEEDVNGTDASPFDASNLGKSELSLEATRSLLSDARKILTNTDVTVDTCQFSDDENQDENNSKFYSLFYKENWNNAVACKEYANKNSAKKKSIKVPDDQYLLDAGQKSIGIVTCSKCGVMYQAGDFADEATHKNFHNHLPELRFTGWTSERIVGRYPDGRVIMIVSVDPKPWWHKVGKIVDIVDQELGFAEGSVKSLFYKTVYLYINEKAKQIVGCLIAEECKEAYKMFPPLEGVDVDSCSKDPSPCKVGISRIWTALNHRRQGVAKRLIDCMRRTFLFGEIVPMDLVAFSVPSPSGKLLAQNVTGKLDFLVYGFA